MNGKTYIFVCKDGWVYVARVKFNDNEYDSLFITTDKFAVIRKWGTSKGLGELAEKGPLRETILESEPEGVQIARMDIKRQIPCNEKNWSNW